MTKEEQQEGDQLLSKWHKNRGELKMQREGAAGIANKLSQVADILRSKPESLSFSDEESSMKYVHPMASKIDRTILDWSTIQKLRDAIIELEEDQQRLKPRLVQLGHTNSL